MVEYFIGPGINYSNVTFTGATVSRGVFTNGSTTNLGVDHGIALTSGLVSYIPGPNTSSSLGYSNGTPGDPLLTSLIPSTTYDASVLEFDFVPAADTAWCQYVFGSEEYSEWVTSQFNDVFGFFVNGPNPEGGVYSNQNIALVPGTLVPVSVNNINYGYAPPGVPTTGPGTNSEYFIDNLNGETIQYDGFTTVLVAKVAVIPGETYHFKLAIADAGDGIYDSGVLLQGESFKSQGSADFLSFGFPAGLNPALSEDIFGTIEDDMVTVELPYGTDVTNLIAEYETPAAVIVTIDGAIQQSGVSANDFTLPVSYHLSGRNEMDWQVTVDLVVGIPEKILHDVSIYPNPADGKFEIQNAATVDIAIFNLIGTTVLDSKTGEHGNVLQVLDPEPGIYFAVLQKDGYKETRKVVVH